MAELFDLSHTLRRERELSSGSAAHLDLTENKEVLPHFGEPGGPKKTQFNNKTNSETSKQVTHVPAMFTSLCDYLQCVVYKLPFTCLYLM